MTKVLTTATTTAPVTVSAKARIARTLAQIAAADAMAQPILDSVQHLISPARAAELSGIASGVAFVVSTLMNVAEHFGLTPTIGGKVVAPVTAGLTVTANGG